MKEHYIKQVKRELLISRRQKNDVLRDLDEVFTSAMEHGETEQQVIERLGSPKDFAISTEEQLGIDRTALRKRNNIIFIIISIGVSVLAFVLFAVFAINRACSISRSSPYMDSFGDLYTLAFKNLTSLFLPIVLGMFATTLFFDEQKNDTLKELLIIPISKAQLYFTKVAVVILMSVVLCMVTFLLSVLGGFVAGGFPDLNAESLLQSALLYLTGGVLVPVAMLPIIFLATLSKGYVLPIGATLLYLVPVVIAPAYLMGLHPLASVMEIYTRFSPAAAEMVESWTQGAPTTASLELCLISILIVGIISAGASVIALRKQSY